MDKENTKKLAEQFIGLSDDEKRDFIRITRNHWPDFNFPKYENPQTSIENVKELQEKMVQLCLDYMIEHNLNDIDEISFSADMLQESKEYGEWTPATDSYISVIGFQEDEKDVKCRKIIGEYF